MIRPAMLILSLGILCASAMAPAHAQQQPQQGAPGEGGQTKEKPKDGSPEGPGKGGDTKEKPKGPPEDKEKIRLRLERGVKHRIYGSVYVKAGRSDITGSGPVRCTATVHVSDEGGIGDKDLTGIFTKFNMSSGQHRGEEGSHGDSLDPDPEAAENPENPKKPFPDDLGSDTDCHEPDNITAKLTKLTCIFGESKTTEITDGKKTDVNQFESVPVGKPKGKDKKKAQEGESGQKLIDPKTKEIFDCTQQDYIGEKITTALREAQAAKTKGEITELVHLFVCRRYCKKEEIKAKGPALIPSESNETPPTEAPPRETRQPQEQRSVLPGPPGTESSSNFTPSPARTVTFATDGVKWCTFGLARGVATVVTPIDTKANLIASAAPAEAAATANTTPSATDRPPSTPKTSQAITERPKEVAPPPASLLPRARPAPMTPMTDNPPGAGTPEQPNTTEQTPPATPPPPAALNTRSPSASDRPAPTPPISDRPPGNTPSARTPEQPQMTDQMSPPSDNPASPTADLVPTPVTVTIDINEKATPEVVAKNVEEAKPMAEPAAAVKLKPAAPELPGSGEKRAHDEGSEKPPTTGRVGGQITTDDAQALGLASGPGAPTHYRAEIDAPEHSGFVAETTGKPVKPAELASALPAGVKATIDTVQIGGRTHTRVGLDWARSQKLDPTALAASISRAIGARLGIDTCRRTKPAPALDPEPASASATVSVLPATIIKLRRTAEPGRTR